MKTAYQLVSIPPPADPAVAVVVAAERYTYRISRVVIDAQTVGAGPFPATVPVLEVFDGAGNRAGTFALGEILPVSGGFVVVFAPVGITQDMKGVLTAGPFTTTFDTNELLHTVPIPNDILIDEGMSWTVRLFGATAADTVINSITVVRFVDPTS